MIFANHFETAPSFVYCVRRPQKSPRPAKLSSSSAEIEQWNRPNRAVLPLRLHMDRVEPLRYYKHKLASIFVAEIIPYWEPFAGLAMTNTSYFKRALLGMKELFTAGDYFLHYRRVFLHFSDCALPKDKAFDVSLH